MAVKWSHTHNAKWIYLCVCLLPLVLAKMFAFMAFLQKSKSVESDRDFYELQRVCHCRAQLGVLFFGDVPLERERGEDEERAREKGRENRDFEKDRASVREPLESAKCDI